MLGPDGRVYHDACAGFLGYLPGQPVDILAPYQAVTVNGEFTPWRSCTGSTAFPTSVATAIVLTP